MTESAVEIAKIDWPRLFPWVRLFRVFRTAIDLRMLILGSLALWVLEGGNAALSHLPFAGATGQADVSHAWDQPATAIRPLDLPAEVLRNPWSSMWAAASDWGRVLRPLGTVADPVLTILKADASYGQKASAWIRLLWALCVWAVAAGAMTRIAAVEQARDARITLSAALWFSIRNFPAYMTAALLPAAGLAVFWILCLIGGWIGRIPAIGLPLLGLVWGVELLFGFIMALILIGVGAGWPLMYATISTEASDGFDGFSRAYSYVFSRPWHYLWFAVVAMAYGAFVITFVYLVAELVVYLAAAGVASGLGLAQTGELQLGAPESIGGARILHGANPIKMGIGTVFAGVWLEAVGLLASGFVVSYFWTASAVIYLLLRQVDDATEFQEVRLPEEKETDDLLPLVGVAASQQPVIERPPAGDFASGAGLGTSVRANDGQSLISSGNPTAATPPPTAPAPQSKSTDSGK